VATVIGCAAMSLTGPSRTIIVQPIEAPDRAPAPREAPEPDKPAPEREITPEPQHEPAENSGAA